MRLLDHGLKLLSVLVVPLIIWGAAIERDRAVLSLRVQASEGRHAALQGQLTALRTELDREREQRHVQGTALATVQTTLEHVGRRIDEALDRMGRRR